MTEQGWKECQHMAEGNAQLVKTARELAEDLAREWRERVHVLKQTPVNGELQIARSFGQIMTLAQCAEELLNKFGGS